MMKINVVIRGGGFDANNRVYGIDGIAPCLGSGHQMTEVKILIQEKKQSMDNNTRTKVVGGYG